MDGASITYRPHHAMDAVSGAREPQYYYCKFMQITLLPFFTFLFSFLDFETCRTMQSKNQIITLSHPVR